MSTEWLCKLGQEREVSIRPQEGEECARRHWKQVEVRWWLGGEGRGGEAGASWLTFSSPFLKKLFSVSIAEKIITKEKLEGLHPAHT